jgi:hypothetical protein
MGYSPLSMLILDLIGAGILIWLMRNNDVQRALLLFAGFAVSARVIGFLIGGSFGLYGLPSMFIGLAGATGLLIAVTRGWNPLAGKSFAMPPAQATTAVHPATASLDHAPTVTASTNRQFCSNCGVSNVLEDRFCAECGSGL